MDNPTRPEAAIDPAEIDAAVLADKLAEADIDPWVAADLAYNRAKEVDPLRQADADRAMRDELRLPAAMRGAA